MLPLAWDRNSRQHKKKTQTISCFVQQLHRCLELKSSIAQIRPDEPAFRFPSYTSTSRPGSPLHSTGIVAIRLEILPLVGFVCLADTLTCAVATCAQNDNLQRHLPNWDGPKELHSIRWKRKMLPCGDSQALRPITKLEIKIISCSHAGGGARGPSGHPSKGSQKKAAKPPELSCHLVLR